MMHVESWLQMRNGSCTNCIERIVQNNETVLEVELAKIQTHNAQSKNGIEIEKKRIVKVNESISAVRNSIDQISEMIKSKVRI